MHKLTGIPFWCCHRSLSRSCQTHALYIKSWHMREQELKTWYCWVFVYSIVNGNAIAMYYNLYLMICMCFLSQKAVLSHNLLIKCTFCCMIITSEWSVVHVKWELTEFYLFLNGTLLICDPWGIHFYIMPEQYESSTGFTII